MCGIAGFYDAGLTYDEAGSLIHQMLESIRHRGPDASGEWIEQPIVLGHNRLSIIDLSESANQPMHYKDLVITYNGEIYNYLEIREELVAKEYKFSTSSDTEVILAAYCEWGSECVKKFMGMWAFAIWDKQKKQLFCSRDRFGIKPFYYIHRGDKFCFGSEYKALKKSALFSSTLNLAQISRGLQLGWSGYEDETYFEVIKALPAASNLIFENGKVTVEKYWDIDPTVSDNRSFEEKKDDFRNLFDESLKLHMRSDVEVGGCLSGGIDSSSIAAGVATYFPDAQFKTFTVFYEGKGDVDERPWANEVIDKYENLKSFYESPKDDDIADVFDKMLYHFDVPPPGSSPLSQYFVMKLVADNKIKVVLDGQGADEYLAGYMHSFYRPIGEYFWRLRLMKAGTLLRNHCILREFGFRKKTDIFLKSVLAGLRSEQWLYGFEYRNYFPFVANSDRSNVPFDLKKRSGSKLNNFLYNLTFTTSLPALLHSEDRNSMAFSIESRVPFLDHRLVEFGFSLQDEDITKNAETKYILRKALSGLLPEATVHRHDKKGFVTPGENKWLRGPLKHLVQADFSHLDMLNKKVVNNVIQDYNNGNNKNANLVWRLAIFNKWVESI